MVTMVTTNDYNESSEVKATDFSPSGLTGAINASRYVGATVSGHPTSGTFAVGDFVIDQSGTIWICTTAPSTWTQVGTVTSVGVTTSGTLHSVTGSPVTGSGTITLTLNTQSANQVFAGPTTGSAAAPTFRSLVISDIPATEAVNTANSGTTYTIPDVSVATINYITMTGNCTFTFPTAAAGNSFVLVLGQDATGSRTAAWPATVKWPGGTAPTLTTTANKADMFSFICVNGTSWLGVTAGQNF